MKNHSSIENDNNDLAVSQNFRQCEKIKPDDNTGICCFGETCNYPKLQCVTVLKPRFLLAPAMGKEANNEEEQS